MSHPRSTLDPQLAPPWDLVAISIAVCIAIVAALVVATVVARRRRPCGPLAGGARRDRRPRPGVVVAVAVALLVVVALVAASSVSDDDLEGDPDALHVRITGHQWWWQIDYEPEDAERRATTANELRLPVGRTIRLELVSADVIHGFWVPRLHGKRDLIPGRPQSTWLRVDRAGVYLGQCGELCGLEHARMELAVVVEGEDAFEVWRRRQREPAAPPRDPEHERGLRVFTGGPCASCHTIAGTGAIGRLGPDLTHVASRTMLGAGALPNTNRQLARWILDPQAIKPGVRMPAIALPTPDLHALVAYLRGLE
jgi:cytochrome c oxidase subunit II